MFWIRHMQKTSDAFSTTLWNAILPLGPPKLPASLLCQTLPLGQERYLAGPTCLTQIHRCWLEAAAHNRSALNLVLLGLQELCKYLLCSAVSRHSLSFWSERAQNTQSKIKWNLPFFRWFSLEPRQNTLSLFHRELWKDIFRKAKKSSDILVNWGINGHFTVNGGSRAFMHYDEQKYMLSIIIQRYF